MRELRQLLFIGLTALALSSGNGLRCYECPFPFHGMRKDEDLGLGCSLENPKHRIEVNCTGDGDFCRTFKGRANGADVKVLLGCGPRYPYPEEDVDKPCVPSTHTDFQLTDNNGFFVPLEGEGEMCYCEADLCNVGGCGRLGSGLVMGMALFLFLHFHLPSILASVLEFM